MILEALEIGTRKFVPDDQGEPRRTMHGNVVARNILSDGTTARPASGHPKARVTASGVNSGSPGQGLRGTQVRPYLLVARTNLHTKKSSGMFVIREIRKRCK